MTRDEILKLATDAGFHFYDAGHAPILHTPDTQYSEFCFIRFVVLVAAAEREACAKLCEEIEAEYRERESLWYSELRTDAQTGASECANRIRSR